MLSFWLIGNPKPQGLQILWSSKFSSKLSKMMKSHGISPDSGLLQNQVMVLRGSRIYSIHTIGASSPINWGEGEVATGVLYLLPGSDLKTPMGQWMRQTRMIDRYAILGSGKHSVLSPGCADSSLSHPGLGPGAIPSFTKERQETEKSRPRFSSKYDSFHQDKRVN